MTAGRRLNLPKTIHDYDFALLAKKEKHARTRIRLLGLEQLKNGKTAREVALHLCVHENTVKRWLNSFSKQGLDGLKEGIGRGAKRKVSKDQEEIFRASILKLQANRKGGRIRGRDVLTLMKEKLGINCSLDTAYESLKRANFVWITSRSRCPNSSHEDQEDFKKKS
ncbi:MAG: helix-turn-helix domain-containing protein [Parachlamydiaceae bacterium]